MTNQNSEVDNFDFSVYGRVEDEPASLPIYFNNLDAEPEKPASEEKAPLAPQVQEQPQKTHFCNDPAHKIAAVHKTACKAHAVKKPELTDQRKRRRSIAKVVAFIVVGFLTFNVINALTVKAIMNPTSATSINAPAQQVSNVEMVTADTSLRREYVAVQIQLLRHGTLRGYYPTPGYALIYQGSKVALVTTLGTNCWLLLADKTRISVRQDATACGPDAVVQIKSQMQAGF